MTTGDRRVLDAPVIYKGQHHPDAIQHGSVPSTALRSAYASVNTKDRFAAQWWRPMNLAVGSASAWPRWDGQISSAIVYESDLWMHDAWDRLTAHVVFAIEAEVNATIRTQLRIDGFTSNNPDGNTNVGLRQIGASDAPEWDVGQLAGGHYPALWDVFASTDIPPGSLNTYADVELLVETSREDGLGAVNYALVGVTLWGDTV
jgi:hypothetical protein